MLDLLSIPDYILLPGNLQTKANKSINQSINQKLIHQTQGLCTAIDLNTMKPSIW